MSCRLYTATNASCIVGGQPPAGEQATIGRDFEAGVSLVVDTTGDGVTVRGAIPADRGAPEALVGVVHAANDDDDPLGQYHDEIRELFDGRSGWRIRTDVVNGQLFEAVGRPDGSAPADELLSSVRREDDERIEIGAPDATDAVGILRSLLERGDGGVYVISTQEPPDHIDADVFVHLSDRYTSPELIDLETDLSDTERVERRLDELADDRSPEALATLLEAEAGRRGLSLGFEPSSSERRPSGSALLGGVVGLAFAVLFTGGAIAATGGTVPTAFDRVPVVGSMLPATLPSWLPSVAGLVVAGTIVSAPLIRRRLGNVVGDLGSGDRPTPAPEHRERLETVGAVLEQHSLDVDGDPYRTAKSALGTHPIEPVRRSSVQGLTGVVALAAPAVAVAGAGWLLLGTLPLATQATLLVALAVVSVMARAGIVLTRSGSRSSGTSSAGANPAGSRQPDGNDGSGVRREDSNQQSDPGISPASGAADADGSDTAAPKLTDDGRESTPEPAGADRPHEEDEFDAQTSQQSSSIAGAPTNDETAPSSSTDGADWISPTDDTNDPDEPAGAADESSTDDPDDATGGTETTGSEVDPSGDEPRTTDRSTDGDQFVQEGAGRPAAGADEAAPTLGPFTEHFGELPVTTAPVVVDDQLFVAGDAGLHDRSVPRDREWLPADHRDTLRDGRIQSHLTRVGPHGERERTVPFADPFAEPIVGGEGAVYAVDSSGTVAALGSGDSLAIGSFRGRPAHFSAGSRLYISDDERSYVVDSELGILRKEPAVFSVAPVTVGSSLVLCFENGRTRWIDLTNDRVDEFDAPHGQLVGSATAGGTPYVASESGVVWSGWKRGWEQEMSVQRTGFRWFSASERTLVLAGRSALYTRDTASPETNSLEIPISHQPVVANGSIYVVSNGELVRADETLSTTARTELPWPSIDGLTAGPDRLYVVADGSVWTAPFAELP